MAEEDAELLKAHYAEVSRTFQELVEDRARLARKVNEECDLLQQCLNRMCDRETLLEVVSRLRATLKSTSIPVPETRPNGGLVEKSEVLSWINFLIGGNQATAQLEMKRGNLPFWWWWLKWRKHQLALKLHAEGAIMALEGLRNHIKALEEVNRVSPSHGTCASCQDWNKVDRSWPPHTDWGKCHSPVLMPLVGGGSCTPANHRCVAHRP